MNRLKRLWGNLRSSFWFASSLIVAVSIGIALALIDVDSTGAKQWLARWPCGFGVGTAGAHRVYYTLADSRMGPREKRGARTTNRSSGP